MLLINFLVLSFTAAAASEGLQTSRSPSSRRGHCDVRSSCCPPFPASSAKGVGVRIRKAGLQPLAAACRSAGKARCVKIRTPAAALQQAGRARTPVHPLRGYPPPPLLQGNCPTLESHLAKSPSAHPAISTTGLVLASSPPTSPPSGSTEGGAGCVSPEQCRERARPKRCPGGDG
jgi:hypothetical protein